ncbi:hypothetical protein, partial [Asaia siamensis]|uniref:hypothetical protein n=1 Tax=Asaia siamensis TaxID=110479 RepID=UPI001E51486C
LFSLASNETDEPESVRSFAADNAEPSIVSALPALSATLPPSEARTDGVQTVLEDDDLSSRMP